MGFGLEQPLDLQTPCRFSIRGLSKPKQKPARNGMPSPVDFENRQRNVNHDDVQKAGRYADLSARQGPVHSREPKPGINIQGNA